MRCHRHFFGNKQDHEKKMKDDVFEFDGTQRDQCCVISRVIRDFDFRFAIE